MIYFQHANGHLLHSNPYFRLSCNSFFRGFSLTLSLRSFTISRYASLSLSPTYADVFVDNTAVTYALVDRPVRKIFLFTLPVAFTCTEDQ